MVGAREFWKSRNLGPHVPEFLWDFMVIGSRILGTVPIFSSADLKDKKGKSEMNRRWSLEDVVCSNEWITLDLSGCYLHVSSE